MCIRDRLHHAQVELERELEAMAVAGYSDGSKQITKEDKAAAKAIASAETAFVSSVVRKSSPKAKSDAVTADPRGLLDGLWDDAEVIRTRRELEATARSGAVSAGLREKAQATLEAMGDLAQEIAANPGKSAVEVLYAVVPLSLIHI